LERGRGVRQLGRADPQRLPHRHVTGPLCHGHPVIRAGEPDPVELAQHLSEDVRAGERGTLASHRVHRDLRRLGEHLVGQVTGSQQRQVVAVCQGSHPCDRVAAQHLPGSPKPPPDQLSQGMDAFVWARREGGLLAQL